MILDKVTESLARSGLMYVIIWLYNYYFLPQYVATPCPRLTIKRHPTGSQSVPVGVTATFVENVLSNHYHTPVRRASGSWSDVRDCCRSSSPAAVTQAGGSRRCEQDNCDLPTIVHAHRRLCHLTPSPDLTIIFSSF